jgi:hypothetical protein
MARWRSQQVNFINLNGSYNATFKAKCRGGGLQHQFQPRPAGWHDLPWEHDGKPRVSAQLQVPDGRLITIRSQRLRLARSHQTVAYSFTCTGSCLIQDADVVEGFYSGRQYYSLP